MEESERQLDLQGQIWQLQGVECGKDNTVIPSNPNQDTLEFGEKRIVLLRADCNYGSGTYEQACTSHLDRLSE